MMAVQAASVRMLGLDPFGEAAFLLSIPLFAATFIGMVSGELVIQVFSRSVSSRDEVLPAYYGGILRREARYILVFGPAVAACLILIWLYGRSSSIGVAALALLIVPASFGYQTNYNLLMSKFRFQKVTYLAWGEVILMPLLLPLPWAWGVPGYLAMFILKSTILSGASFVLARNEIGKHWGSAEDLPAKMAVLKHQQSSLIVKSVWSNLDITVMGLFSGNGPVAEYRIIKSLVNMLPTAAQPIWTFLKPKILEKARNGSWKEVKYKITRIAGLLMIPLIGMSVMAIPLLDPVVSRIYGITPSPQFQLIFWFCFVSTAVANVLTGWSRFLAVVRDELRVSLNLNLFLAAILVVSPIGQLGMGIPVPILLSLGTIAATIFWWRWLLAIR